MKVRIFTLSFILYILSATTSSTLSNAYDLGGPCYRPYDPANQKLALDNMKMLHEQKRAKNWARAIEYEKVEVRLMCNNKHRWFSLIELLLVTGDKNGAVSATNEIYDRGMSIAPDDLENWSRISNRKIQDAERAQINRISFGLDIPAFLKSTEFKSSKAGHIYQAAYSAAQERRKSFQIKLSQLKPGELPQKRFVTNGACPFECCSYREWTPKEDVELFDSPHGKTQIGQAVKDQKVQAVTGQVEGEPTAIGIVYDQPPFAKGDIVFLLDYQGEGAFDYWYKGRQASGGFDPHEYCPNPDSDCWAEYILPENTRKQNEWWVKIKLPNGREGWTDQASKFDGRDACG